MLAKIEECALIIMNVQNEIIPLLKNGDKMVHDCCWLAELADTLGIPTILAIHDNLGSIHNSLIKAAPSATPVNIVNFSIMQNENARDLIKQFGKKQIILIGCEAHISIYQSAIELREANYDVFVISNSITSRNNFDIDMFRNRCLQLGIHLVSKEMIFCALIKGPTFPHFTELCTKFLGEKIYC